MSFDVLVEIALKSGLVTATALLLVTLLKGLPASQRAWIAHIGLLLTLLMPVFVLAGPDLKFSGPWSRTIATPPAVEALTLTGPVVASGPAAPAATTAAIVIPDAGQLVLGGWALVAAALVLALAIGLARLFRLQREASVLTDRDWLCALAQAQHTMGMKQGTALLRSEQLTSPVSWGLLRPTIVLSPAALKSPDKAAAILAHELAHVVRMDWVNLLISRLATAVFWFNPLVWSLAWQAHELREEAADDVVLRSDVDGPDYAALLVDFARGECAGTGLAAHGVAPGKGSLRRRLMRVLDRDARRDPARPLWVAGCAAGALLLAAPLAAFTPVDRVAGAPAVAFAVSPIPGMAIPAFIDRPPAARIGSTTPETAVAAATSGAEALAPTVTAVVTPSAGPQSQAPSGGRLSPEILGRMRLHGVTPEWIAAMEREFPGMRRLSAEEMVTLAIHGVSPDWIRSMREVGYRDLSHDQLATLAVHGVTPAYIRELEGAGYRNLPVDDVVKLRIFGVDADYVRRMEAEGLRVDVDEVVRERAVRRRPPPKAPEPPAPPAPVAPPAPLP